MSTTKKETHWLKLILQNMDISSTLFYFTEKYHIHQLNQSYKWLAIFYDSYESNGLHKLNLSLRDLSKW